VLASVALPFAAAPAQAAVGTPTTVVSFTFDDGFASQLNAVSILRSHNLHGTFYVNSSFLGQTGRLTVANLQSMQAAGNEIAGHTLTHSYLPAELKAEQLREVCNDRYALTHDGLTVTDFAYPYGAFDKTTQQVVASCGYNSARATGGLGTSAAWAESMPPQNVYAVRAEPSVITTTTLASIESEISTAIAHGGGWVPLVFHNVCAACGEMAMTPSDFTALTSWVVAERAHGVVVKTVAQVINKPAQPAKKGPANITPAGQIINGSLAQTVPALDGAATGEAASVQLTTPYCWEPGQFGVNQGTWKHALVPGTKKWAETVTITSYKSGDRKLLIRRDSGGCSPSVVVGNTYTVAARYESNSPVRVVVYKSDASGRWTYWASSPKTTPTAGWQTISFVTPAVPSGTTNLSYGVALAQVGFVSTTDYTMKAQITHPRAVGAIVGTTAAAAIAIVALAIVRVRRAKSVTSGK